MKNKYGQEHRDAREKKIQSLGENPTCEVTKTPYQLEAHHNVPRLFNGPDHTSNYMMLNSTIHQKVLHNAANISDPQLVNERQNLTRQLMRSILDDEKREGFHTQIRHIDENLIGQYINNLLNRLPFHFREKIIELTLVSNFECIRDLSIEVELLKKRLQAITTSSGSL